MRFPWPATVCLLAVGLGSSLVAQEPLTLAEALARADRQGYANRIAGALVQIREGEGLGALRGILPSIRIEAGWVRSTDPLAAFGATLRQRAVTPVAFDPSRLNDPDPTSNVAAAVVLEQPLLNLDAWAGRNAARSATRASEAARDWTESATRVAVIRTWFGGVLAAEKVRSLESALQAARSHSRQAGALLEQGMVARADLLLAEVRTGELEADLAAARGELGLMVRRLALVIGAPADTTLRLPASFPGLEALEATLGSLRDATGDPTRRGDVEAARLGQVAAQADLRRARAGLLPRINGFARYDWNRPDALFAGDPAWTVGVMATWSPFSGASELSAVRAARGRMVMAAAGSEAATAQAGLEAAERENALAVALERLTLANRAVAQSTEAHRLVGRSYAGGLATITDLLGAAAAETGSRLGLAAAVYQAIVAAAERQQALGLSLEALTALGR